MDNNHMIIIGLLLAILVTSVLVLMKVNKKKCSEGFTPDEIDKFNEECMNRKAVESPGYGNPYCAYDSRMAEDLCGIDVNQFCLECKNKPAGYSIKCDTCKKSEKDHALLLFGIHNYVWTTILKENVGKKVENKFYKSFIKL